MAQHAGIASLADRSYADKTRIVTARYRRELIAGLRNFDALKVYESDANFILLRIITPSLNALTLKAKLLRMGIAVRVCSNFSGLDAGYFRVAVRTPAENWRLLKALSAVLEE